MIALFVVHVGLGAMALQVSSVESASLRALEEEILASAPAAQSSGNTDSYNKCCPGAQCKYDDSERVISDWNDCFSTSFTEYTTVEYQENGLYVRTPDGMDGNCLPAAYIKGASAKSGGADESAIWTPNQMYSLREGDEWEYIGVGAIVKTDVGNGMRVGANYAHDANACDGTDTSGQWPAKRFNAPFGIHFDSTPMYDNNGKAFWMGDGKTGIFEADMSGDNDGGPWEQHKDNAHCRNNLWGAAFATAFKKLNGQKTYQYTDDMISCWYSNDEMDDHSALSQTQNYMWYGYIDNGEWDIDLGKNSHGAPKYWGWNEIPMKGGFDDAKYWHGLYLKLPAGAESLQQLSHDALGDAVTSLRSFRETLKQNVNYEVAKNLHWAIKKEIQDETKNYRTEFGCQNFVFEYDANSKPSTYMFYDVKEDKCAVVIDHTEL